MAWAAMKREDESGKAAVAGLSTVVVAGSFGVGCFFGYQKLITCGDEGA